MKVLEDLRQARTLVRRIYSGRLRRLHRTVLSFLLTVFFVFPALAQEGEEAGNSNKPAEETIVKPPAVRYESSKLKDPFFHPAPPKTASKKAPSADAEVQRKPTLPGIAGTFVDNAGFEGIVVHGNNQRFAIIRSADNRAYFLTEGDRLFDGYLKTIEDDSVVFVRETLMRSGRIVTQEVTKRLRKS